MESWRPIKRDLLLTGVLLVVAITYTAFDAPTVAGAEYTPYDARGYALITASVLPMAWRTRLPTCAAWLTFVLWAAISGFNYPNLVVTLCLFFAFYGLGAYTPRGRAVANSVVMGVLFTAWTLIGHFTYDTVPLSAAVAGVFVVSIPVIFGMVERRRRLELAALEMAAAKRALEAHDAAADAVRAERARIARELHDVVAHEITVMTLQAEGARLRLSKSEPEVADMFGAISQAGRRGLTEMQRMIGVLRTSEREASARKPVDGPHGDREIEREAPELSPMPSLATLPALINSVHEAGLPAHLTVVGSSHVPAGVELSTYRIVQEALTNALKYAGPGASAFVQITREPTAVTIVVEDDGRGTISEAAQSSGGHGLDGMAERVSLLGGHFTYGPRTGGGFRVEAMLPVSDDQVGVGRLGKRRHVVRADVTTGESQ